MITLYVKSKHLKGAKRSSCRHCLVARVIRGRFPKSPVYVYGNQDVEVGDSSFLLVAGQSIIAAFDNSTTSAQRAALVGRKIILEKIS